MKSELNDVKVKTYTTALLRAFLVHKSKRMKSVRNSFNA
jgi:hypothetical protein